MMTTATPAAIRAVTAHPRFQQFDHVDGSVELYDVNADMSVTLTAETDKLAWELLNSLVSRLTPEVWLRFGEDVLYRFFQGYFYKAEAV